MKPLERRHIKTTPHPWTPDEEDLLLRLIKSNQASLKRLRIEFPGRTLASIRAKRRKVRIRNDLFGDSYRQEKSTFTENIGTNIRPNSVFDAYAGTGHQTEIWARYANNVFASEIEAEKHDLLVNRFARLGYKKSAMSDGWIRLNRKKQSIYAYQGDAVKASASIATNWGSIDLVDLDTCGSTLPTIPTFLSCLNPKYLVVTHGEFHSLRFKRKDVLRRILTHRSIVQNVETLSVDELSKELLLSVEACCLRAHNMTEDSYFPRLLAECWLGSKKTGMLRRAFALERPVATSDCINTMVARENRFDEKEGRDLSSYLHGFFAKLRGQRNSPS